MQICLEVDLETKLSSRNFSQKNKRTNLSFYRNDLEILETCILILSFKYFWVIRIEKKEFVLLYFGKIYDSTILFRDLLTFRFVVSKLVKSSHDFIISWLHHITQTFNGLKIRDLYSLFQAFEGFIQYQNTLGLPTTDF